MAWKQMDIGQQRAEFAVRLARGEKLSSLCREYEITSPTGYLWKRRFAEHGVAGLEDRSRRPEHSPHRVQAPMEDDAVEARIVQLRVARPDWGARKLASLLDKEGSSIPAITVHRVLLRHDLVRPADRRSPATQRFERERVNELWQIEVARFV